MRRIRTGDEIVVITGKDKGKRGKVRSVLTAKNKLFVEGINLVKKHVKPNPQKDQKGGIEVREAAIHSSNVMLFNPSTNKGDKVGFKLLENGKKVRYFKSTQKNLDV